MTLLTKSNCWTCKERKVGCDRALPQCLNCTRSKRACKGYGLKLAWPDKADGRRKQKKWKAEPHTSEVRYQTQDGRYAFLNTGFEDMEGKRVGWGELVRSGERERKELVVRGSGSGKGVIVGVEVEVVSKGLALGANRIEAREAALLGYYDSVVARMITTIDDNTNGFRLNLIPMALSAWDASSKSLLQATLALSSFHIGRQEEALQHKGQAIKLLLDSFHDTGASRIAQFSTCMMLCVYSVFDSSDSTWKLHLQGAKTLMRVFSRYERENPSIPFLGAWLEYHDVFSAYSQPALLLPEQRLSDIVLPESTSATQKIVGLLGCSTELLRVISCINQLRVAIYPSQHRTQPPRSSTVESLFILRERLVDLAQSIHLAPGETSGDISHARITLTAEFYRIAALLYLYQNAPAGFYADVELYSFAEQGLSILDQMGICTSPWPLFILACNVTGDADRIKVMRVIEEGARERNVGNYRIIRSIVERVWKKQDLFADEKIEGTVDWRDFIEIGSVMPSFI